MSNVMLVPQGVRYGITARLLRTAWATDRRCENADEGNGSE